MESPASVRLREAKAVQTTQGRGWKCRRQGKEGGWGRAESCCHCPQEHLGSIAQGGWIRGYEGEHTLLGMSPVFTASRPQGVS